MYKKRMCFMFVFTTSNASIMETDAHLSALRATCDRADQIQIKMKRTHAKLQHRGGKTQEHDRGQTEVKRSNITIVDIYQFHVYQIEDILVIYYSQLGDHMISVRAARSVLQSVLVALPGVLEIDYEDEDESDCIRADQILGFFTYLEDARRSDSPSISPSATGVQGGANHLYSAAAQLAAAPSRIEESLRAYLSRYERTVAVIFRSIEEIAGVDVGMYKEVVRYMAAFRADEVTTEDLMRLGGYPTKRELDRYLSHLTAAGLLERVGSLVRFKVPSFRGVIRNTGVGDWVAWTADDSNTATHIFDYMLHQNGLSWQKCLPLQALDSNPSLAAVDVLMKMGLYTYGTLGNADAALRYLDGPGGARAKWMHLIQNRTLEVPLVSMLEWSGNTYTGYSASGSTSSGSTRPIIAPVQLCTIIGDLYLIRGALHKALSLWEQGWPEVTEAMADLAGTAWAERLAVLSRQLQDGLTGIYFLMGRWNDVVARCTPKQGTSNSSTCTNVAWLGEMVRLYRHGGIAVVSKRDDLLDEPETAAEQIQIALTALDAAPGQGQAFVSADSCAVEFLSDFAPAVSFPREQGAALVERAMQRIRADTGGAADRKADGDLLCYEAILPHVRSLGAGKQDDALIARGRERADAASDLYALVGYTYGQLTVDGISRIPAAERSADRAASLVTAIEARQHAGVAFRRPELLYMLASLYEYEVVVFPLAARHYEECAAVAQQLGYSALQVGWLNMKAAIAYWNTTAVKDHEKRSLAAALNGLHACEAALSACIDNEKRVDIEGRILTLKDIIVEARLLLHEYKDAMSLCQETPSNLEGSSNAEWKAKFLYQKGRILTADWPGKDVDTAISLWEEARSIFLSEEEIFFKFYVLRCLVEHTDPEDKQRRMIYVNEILSLYGEVRTSSQISDTSRLVIIGVITLFLGSRADVFEDHQRILYYKESFLANTKTGEFSRAFDVFQRLSKMRGVATLSPDVLREMIDRLLRVIMMDLHDALEIGTLDKLFWLIDTSLPYHVPRQLAQDNRVGDVLRMMGEYRESGRVAEMITAMRDALQVIEHNISKMRLGEMKYTPADNEVTLVEEACLDFEHEGRIDLLERARRVLRILQSIQRSIRFERLGNYYTKEGVLDIALLMFTQGAKERNRHPSVEACRKGVETVHAKQSGSIPTDASSLR